MSFILDDEIHFFGAKNYMDRIGKNAEEVILKKAQELLSKIEFDEKDKKTGEKVTKTKDIISGYKIFTYTCATAGQCIVRMFEEIHPRLPDLLVAWNHQFDISRMLETLQKEGIDPLGVFNHPDVPEKYRRLWFK
ncbi:hypothetical protein PWL12_004977, partial [Salmonella enterica]|nr:hypothetical protein [Salmonella enterica]